LGAALIFGVSGVLVIRYLHPNLVRYLQQNFSSKTLNNSAKVIFAVFLLDILASIQINFS
jgi:uncharacterized membrane protein